MFHTPTFLFSPSPRREKASEEICGGAGRRSGGGIIQTAMDAPAQPRGEGRARLLRRVGGACYCTPHASTLELGIIPEIQPPLGRVIEPATMIEKPGILQHLAHE